MKAICLNLALLNINDLSLQSSDSCLQVYMQLTDSSSDGRVQSWQICITQNCYLVSQLVSSISRTWDKVHLSIQLHLRSLFERQVVWAGVTLLNLGTRHHVTQPVEELPIFRGKGNRNYSATKQTVYWNTNFLFVSLKMFFINVSLGTELPLAWPSF